MLIGNMSQVVPKLPEIGRIYKGMPSGTSTRSAGYQGGDDTNGFLRVELSTELKDLKTERGGFENLYDDLADRIKTRYKAEERKDGLILLRELRIRLPFPNLEHSFPTPTNKVYAKTGKSQICVRECNMVVCSTHTTKEGTKYYVSKDPIPCSVQPDESGIYPSKCPMGCKPRGMLTFVIPDIGYSSGCFVFPLNSGIDIMNTARYLEGYRNMNISLLAWRLSRRESSFNAIAADGASVPKVNHEVTLMLDTAGSRQLMKAQLGAGAADEQLAIEQTSMASLLIMPEPEFEVVEEDLDLNGFLGELNTMSDFEIVGEPEPDEIKLQGKVYTDFLIFLEKSDDLDKWGKTREWIQAEKQIKILLKQNPNVSEEVAKELLQADLAAAQKKIEVVQASVTAVATGKKVIG